MAEDEIKHTMLHKNACDEAEEIADDSVLIAGGGPVGLLLAVVLASYGVKSVILERNETTTKWPKMDLTNARSMELLRRLGLADECRKIGVPSKNPYSVFISTGLHSPSPITSWEFGSVDQLREHIRAKNDGSMPLEPWQRLSQAIFEKWLKGMCDENPLIDCRFGWKVEKSLDKETGVEVSATELKNGKNRKLMSKYLVACDGASSRVRRDMEILLNGGPVPGYVLLIHFRSRDLEKLHRYGPFWHIFTLNEHGLAGAAIGQDDEEIFTTHLLLPLDADHTQIDSHEAVYQVLGGMGEPYKFKIDEILVRSTYRHSIAIASRYRSAQGHVFLAGDSAHQNIPTGGYGMNTGLGDAYDLGWKLASVINKHGGPALLDSYEQERRPVAMTSIQRSGVHMETHLALTTLLGNTPRVVEEDSEAGRALRRGIHDHYQKHNGENTDLGVEMDHRHKSGVYLPPHNGTKEPEWIPSRYTPSTFPGSRAPHIFLKDGTAIFDLYGKHFTLVEFFDDENHERGVDWLLDAAKHSNVPVSHVKLEGEGDARRIWEASLVIVRPDGHVAWRGETILERKTASEIVEVMAGFRAVPQGQILVPNAPVEKLQAFAATVGMESQVEGYELEKMGLMQS